MHCYYDDRRCLEYCDASKGLQLCPPTSVGAMNQEQQQQRPDYCLQRLAQKWGLDLVGSKVRRDSAASHRHP